MAEDKKKEIDVAVIEVTEEYLKEKLYKIRGKRVLLDADLAEIYGYDTKGFNRQVKNNIEKFDEDFMFELTDEELEDLRYKNCTANISSKSRYNPHVFTEQGLYMLMTVLKGPLAVKQSKALIRTFKKMKDYILENRDLIGQREILQLSMETANNRIEINKINSDMISLEKQISDVAEGLKDVVTKSELADMMNSFVSDDDEKWLMFNAKFSSADEVYESIYKQAKSSIYVVDNYIGLRTLVHLKNSPTGVNITLFSDNVGNNKLHTTIEGSTDMIYCEKVSELFGLSGDEIAQRMENFYNDNSDAEKKSWRASLPKLIEVIQSAGLGNLYIETEYELPAGGRIDAALIGDDDNGKHRVLVIELKQWSRDGIEYYANKGFPAIKVNATNPYLSRHPVNQTKEYSDSFIGNHSYVVN